MRSNFSKSYVLSLMAGVATVSGGFWATPAQAQATGDLLVAPTRLVLDGNRGTEVILDNIGQNVATYRISLELRRMNAKGDLDEVADVDQSDKEKAALAMVSYAPRRVTLAPNQPQSVRVGIRPPEGLADGEYRVHMMFRAIPDAVPVADAAPTTGMSIKLIPIYGVLIPVIIRRGLLQATAQLSDVHLEHKGGGNQFDLTLSRAGTRSVYGNIRVMHAGQSKPVYEAKGIAVYAEVTQRKVDIQITPEQAIAMQGPVTVEYRESDDAGGGLITSTQATLR